MIKEKMDSLGYSTDGLSHYKFLRRMQMLKKKKKTKKTSSRTFFKVEAAAKAKV
jgi:hypothetical protein